MSSARGFCPGRPWCQGSAGRIRCIRPVEGCSGPRSCIVGDARLPEGGLPLAGATYLRVLGHRLGCSPWRRLNHRLVGSGSRCPASTYPARPIWARRALSRKLTTRHRRRRQYRLERGPSATQLVRLRSSRQDCGGCSITWSGRPASSVACIHSDGAALKKSHPMQNPSINEAIVIEVIILSGIGSFLAAGAIGIVVLDIRQNVCVVSRRCGPAVAFVPILIVSPQGACNVGRSCYLRNLAVLDHRAGRCHGDARHRHDSQPFPVSRGGRTGSRGFQRPER